MTPIPVSWTFICILSGTSLTLIFQQSLVWTNLQVSTFTGEYILHVPQASSALQNVFR